MNNPQLSSRSASRENTLSTNKVLRSTYALLSATLLFSALMAMASTILNIGYGERVPLKRFITAIEKATSKKAKVNNGSIVMHKAVVNSYAEIGSNCIINSSSLIEHGVKVGNHTHVSTGAILNGDCKVGNNSFIGSGTIVKEGVKIGNRCIIGMGQIIKKNIKDNQIIK